ncbi:MAG: transcriptional regulator, IclR family [Ramlibacter sp.]|jgi:IclR family pca regulon transcriptional regulator|uniref:IclR family transcriptional regulator n=1 Tax=Ramlibacter sp. TaxID=1917967 RepID=UPI002639D74A|nr:helix-turn-helix domain-containing protein [Ramlibacter sp.]MDB5750722.1 transcriptional regulator, IclR family [Ramlibacter sp.]
MVRRRSPDTLALNPERVHGPGEEVDSLLRGLELLRLFDVRHRVLETTEIAAKLGLSRATAAKLVATLQQHNFLRARNPGGGFEPHVACLALGRAVKRGLPIVTAAQPRMLALSQRFGVHVTLSTRDRSHMLVVEHVVPAGQVRLGLDTGARLPLAASASGRAYLWAQPPALRDQLLERIREHDQDGSFRLLSNVYAAFQELAEKGWCFLAAPMTSQTGSLAAPIEVFGRVDYVLTAMAVGPDAQRQLRARVAPELVAHASFIAQDLTAAS